MADSTLQPLRTEAPTKPIPQQSSTLDGTKTEDTAQQQTSQQQPQSPKKDSATTKTANAVTTEEPPGFMAEQMTIISSNFVIVAAVGLTWLSYWYFGELSISLYVCLFLTLPTL